MPEILYELYSRSYYAPLGSISGCLCISILITIFTLPFFTSFYIGNFWTSSYSYYESPHVNFNNEYIITVLENGVSKYYSSFASQNLLYPNILTSPTLHVIPISIHDDQTFNQYNIIFKFNSNPNLIQNIRIILFWDYILQDNISLKTQTITYLDFDFVYPASYIRTTGTIRLKQKSPINSRTIGDAFANTGIFANYTFPLPVNEIYDYYSNMNLTTYYDYQKVVMPYMSTSDTTLDMTFIIPTYQKITAVSSTAKILKNAWPKYFCLFIPTALIGYLLMDFLFRYKILQSSYFDTLPEDYKNKRN